MQTLIRKQIHTSRSANVEAILNVSIGSNIVGKMYSYLILRHMSVVPLCEFRRGRWHDELLTSGVLLDMLDVVQPRGSGLGRLVDDDLGDDIFGELVREGERDLHEDPGFEFQEWGVDDGGAHAGASYDEPEDDEDESWEARFAKFKQAQKQAGPPSHGSDLDEFSEGGDTIGDLPQLSVIGGKKRRKGTSDASGYSMSSSSMFRNQGLTLIDEQFEQVRSFLK